MQKRATSASCIASARTSFDIRKKASKILRPFKLYPQKLVNIKVKTKKPLDQSRGWVTNWQKWKIYHMRHLIRYSGTENKLRLLLEGKDAKVMEKAMDKLVAF